MKEGKENKKKMHANKSRKNIKDIMKQESNNFKML
jgi:hypothetical protein